MSKKRSVAKGGVEKLMTFERKLPALLRTYGPILKKGEHRIKTNKEIFQMYLCQQRPISMTLYTQEQTIWRFKQLCINVS